MAARNGLTVVVQELLAKGASVLAVDENGKYLTWTAVCVMMWFFLFLFFALVCFLAGQCPLMVL